MLHAAERRPDHAAISDASDESDGCMTKGRFSSDLVCGARLVRGRAAPCRGRGLALAGPRCNHDIETYLLNNCSKHIIIIEVSEGCIGVKVIPSIKHLTDV